MALTSELRVFADLYKLTRLIVVDVTPNFPRKYRYSLGERIETTCYELFDKLYLANMYKAERVRHLNDFILVFERLKLLVRIAGERHHGEAPMLSIGRQADIAEMMAKIGKQITAWKNAPQTRASKELREPDSATAGPAS